MNKYKIVVGMGFGDEGKGTMVDYLASSGDYGFVARFSGGAQAAHNVITPDGKHHTFSQIGSGAFHGTKTILTNRMIFHPFAFTHEAEAFEKLTGYDAYENTYISENALITTPYHVAINKMREKARGNDRHGSCAMGVGETKRMYLERNLYPSAFMLAGDLKHDKRLVGFRLGLQYHIAELVASDLGLNVDDFLESTPDEIENGFSLVGDVLQDKIVSDQFIGRLINNNNIIFEGSQGILLDEWHGFHPHTTWSTTTSQHARNMLLMNGVLRKEIETIGVTRTYLTRHGAGPFPSEFEQHMAVGYPEMHNAWGEFQGGWRVGAFDAGLFKYACRADRNIDSFALTHYDVPAPYLMRDFSIPSRISSYTDENLEKRSVKMQGWANRMKTMFNHDMEQTKGEYNGTWVDKRHRSIVEWDTLLSYLSNGKKLKYVSSGPTYKDKIEVDSLIKV